MSNIWEEFNMVVPTPGGDREVRALRHQNSRGLAIVHNPFGFYAVTHVATGKKIGAPFERVGNAMICMAQLALCFDWTGDAEAIKREIEERGGDPVPFDGATSTSGGITRPMSRKELFESCVGWFDSNEFPWEETDPIEVAERLLARSPVAATEGET